MEITNSQIKDDFCEVTLKSEFKINQSVRLITGHPIYSEDSFVIKNIRFNEKERTFEYLLETKDSSRFWQNQENIQDMNNISYKEFPLTFNLSDLSKPEGYSYEVLNIPDTFKEIKLSDFSTINFNSETEIKHTFNNEDKYKEGYYYGFK